MLESWLKTRQTSKRKLNFGNKVFLPGKQIAPPLYFLLSLFRSFWSWCKYEGTWKGRSIPYKNRQQHVHSLQIIQSWWCWCFHVPTCNRRCIYQHIVVRCLGEVASSTLLARSWKYEPKIKWIYTTRVSIRPWTVTMSSNFRRPQCHQPEQCTSIYIYIMYIWTLWSVALNSRYGEIDLFSASTPTAYRIIMYSLTK